jgi:hypothetical protein
VGKCSECGGQTGFMMQMCDNCIHRLTPETTRATRPNAVTAEMPNNTRAGTLVTLGMLCLAIALYFLVIDPTAPSSIDLGGLATIAGQRTVNLQKLAIGMAAAIAGSVFLTGGVVAWRD